MAPLVHIFLIASVAHKTHLCVCVCGVVLKCAISSVNGNFKVIKPLNELFPQPLGSSLNSELGSFLELSSNELLMIWDRGRQLPLLNKCHMRLALLMNVL